MLMSIGMSRDEYWNGSIYLAFDYIEAEKYRQKRFDEQAWLQGLYVFKAVDTVLANALRKSQSEQYSYPDKPFTTTKTEEEKRLEEENEMLRAEIYMKQLIEVGKNWGKEK